MDARVCGGPSAIAKDPSRDVAREEAGDKGRIECPPCHGKLVLCEAAKGIISGWKGRDGPRGKTRRPPKAIRRSGEAGAWAVLIGGTIAQRLAGWVVCETARGRMEELHAGGRNERQAGLPVARIVCACGGEARPMRSLEDGTGKRGTGVCWVRGKNCGGRGERGERRRRGGRRERTRRKPTKDRLWLVCPLARYTAHTVARHEAVQARIIRFFDYIFFTFTITATSKRWLHIAIVRSLLRFTETVAHSRVVEIEGAI